jgi:hypothetical protein
VGGDPCTFREAGELQAEMGKLTHPARPDVDWRRVESLCLALFRQNGVELQTLVCYIVARTKQQGLVGMTDGLEALQTLMVRHWAISGPCRHIQESLCSVGWRKRYSSRYGQWKPSIKRWRGSIVVSNTWLSLKKCCVSANSGI